MVLLVGPKCVITTSTIKSLEITTLLVLIASFQPASFVSNRCCYMKQRKQSFTLQQFVQQSAIGHYPIADVLFFLEHS